MAKEAKGIEVTSRCLLKFLVSRQLQAVGNRSAIPSILGDANQPKHERSVQRGGTFAHDVNSRILSGNVISSEKWQLHTPVWSEYRHLIPGVPMNSALFIELCAGCARLSANVAARGMQTQAVDQSCNRRKQCRPTISLDLADDESVKCLLTLLTAGSSFLPTCSSALWNFFKSP